MNGDEIEAFAAGALLRKVRRIADLSQRELARRTGVSQSTVGRIEAGTIMPTLPVFQRLLSVAGYRLAVVDGKGEAVEPDAEDEELRDGAGRRYPAHLDVVDPQVDGWWGHRYDVAPPTPQVTFRLDRRRRDALRAGEPEPVHRHPAADYLRWGSWPAGFRRRRKRHYPQ